MKKARFLFCMILSVALVITFIPSIAFANPDEWEAYGNEETVCYTPDAEWVMLDVIISGTAPELEYQWEVQDEESGEWNLYEDNSFGSGYDSTSVIPMEAYYRCIVREKGNTSEAYYKYVYFNVIKRPVRSWYIDEWDNYVLFEKGQKTITLDAGSLVVLDDSDYEFEPVDPELTYAWYDMDDNLLEGKTGSTLTVDAVEWGYYSCTITEEGSDQSATVCFTLRENTHIKSMTLKPAKTYELVENVDGYEGEDEDGKYFCYTNPNFNLGDKLTVTFDDGRAAQTLEYGYIGSFAESGSYAFCSADSKTIIDPDNEFSYNSNQTYKTRWTVNHSYSFNIGYRGITCKMPVKIVANPVKKIEYIPISSELIANLDGEIDTDEDGSYFYYYRNPWDGDQLKITTAKGTTVYTYDEQLEDFMNGTEALNEYVSIEGDNQSSKTAWKTGQKHTFTVSVKGAECKFTVTIVPGNVKSISLKPAKAHEVIENAQGYYVDIDEEGTKKYFHYEFEFSDGDELTVVYNDSTQDVFTYDAERWEFSNGTDVIPNRYISCDDTQSATNQWKLGNTYQEQIHYMGKTCSVPVKVVANPVKSISFKPKAAYELVEGIDTGEYDDVSGCYLYNVPQWAQDGDVLTVTYKNGTTKAFTCKDEIFKSSDGQKIPNSLMGGSMTYVVANDQYKNGHPVWKAGGTGNLFIEYMGHKSNTVPVKLLTAAQGAAKILAIVKDRVSKLPASVSELKLEHADILSAAINAYQKLTDAQREAYDKTGSVKAKLIKFEQKMRELEEAALQEYEELKTEAMNVEKAIRSLPKIEQIKESDRAAIEKVRDAFEKLTEEQKEMISKSCRAKLQKALNYLAAWDVERDIKTLPAKPTLKDAEAVAAARAKYEALTSEQKELVSADVLNRLVGIEKSIDAQQKNLKNATIKLAKSKTYNKGKAIKPSVKVISAAGVTLKKGTDYKVSYKNNKKIGKATVTIKAKGKYTGTVKKTFKIVPKGTKISKLKKGKKSFTVKWKKQRNQTSGYQIRYSLKKNFKKAKTVTVKGNKNTSKVIKKLKAKKTYYVQIRTYKTVKGKKYASSWSKMKKVKTK